MIGRLLASAAVAVALGGTAMAQMTPPPASNPPAGSSATPMNSGPGNSTHTMSSSPSSGQPAARQGSSRPTSLGHQATGNAHMSGDRQTAQGQQNNVADKLNACEAKPMQARQACINDATRGMSGGM